MATSKERELDSILAKHCTNMDDHDDPPCPKCADMKADLLAWQAASRPEAPQPAENDSTERMTVLLTACRAMLIKCRDSQYALSPMETTVFYDDANCDGLCLLDDIEQVLTLASEVRAERDGKEGTR